MLIRLGTEVAWRCHSNRKAPRTVEITEPDTLRTRQWNGRRVYNIVFGVVSDDGHH